MLLKIDASHWSAIVIIEKFSAPLAWQIRTLGGHNQSRYEVVVDTYPDDVVIEGKSSGGERLEGSAFTVTMRDLPEDGFISYSLHVIVHEFFHTFEWVFPEGERETAAWFREGLTDYMAYSSLFETSLPLEAQPQFLAYAIERYWNEGISKTLPILEISKNRWESPDRPWTQKQLDFALYGQVDLVSFDADARLRLSKSPVRVWDLMRVLWQRFGKPGVPIRTHDIFDAASEVLGRSVAGEWQRYLATTDELPIAANFRKLGWQIEEGIHSSIGVIPRPSGSSGRLVVRAYLPGLNREELRAIQLQIGDELLSVNGTPIRSIDDLQRALAGVSAGAEVDAVVNRRGEQVRLLVPVSSYRRVTQINPPTCLNQPCVAEDLCSCATVENGLDSDAFDSR